jgi:hypothetical protein
MYEAAPVDVGTEIKLMEVLVYFSSWDCTCS